MTLPSRVAPLLALVVQHVSVPRRRPRELGAAGGACRLCRLARLLPLVSQEVAKGGELASVAAVLPALGLGPALDDSDVAMVGGRGAGGGCRWVHPVHRGARHGNGW